MDKRDEQAVDALKLYYQQDLSQVDIAARMGLSRPTVAKLLAHGRDRGFVTITIHDPREEASELAARLEQRYGLACVRVAHATCPGLVRHERRIRWRSLMPLTLFERSATGVP